MARHMIVAAAFACATLLALPVSASAEGGDPAVRKGGQALFVEHCGACHGDDARGGGVLSESLSVQPANLVVLAAQHDAYWFYDRMTMGWRQMHPQQRYLSEDVRWAISSYLTTLARR